MSVEGFSMVSYPTWESLFVSLNRLIDHRITVCLDEFPYLVKSCPALHIPVELDIVAESFDGKHLFLGECKWQNGHQLIDAKEELERLQTIANGLPFAKGHSIHYALFLRREPKHPDGANIFYPSDILSMTV